MIAHCHPAAGVSLKRSGGSSSGSVARYAVRSASFSSSGGRFSPRLISSTIGSASCCPCRGNAVPGEFQSMYRCCLIFISACRSHPPYMMMTSPGVSNPRCNLPSLCYRSSSLSAGRSATRQPPDGSGNSSTSLPRSGTARSSVRASPSPSRAASVAVRLSARSYSGARRDPRAISWRRPGSIARTDIRTLPIAVLDGHQLLRAVRPHPEHHQRAQPVVFQADVEVDSVDPHVDGVARRQVPAPERLVLLVPGGRQPRDVRRTRTENPHVASRLTSGQESVTMTDPALDALESADGHRFDGYVLLYLTWSSGRWERAGVSDVPLRRVRHPRRR